MKRYTINCHYDMVISVDVIAESEEQALELAREQADRMSIDGAECVGHSECVTDTEALTARELRKMENEAVMKMVKQWFASYSDPTDKDEKRTLFNVAFGKDVPYWMAGISQDTPQWERNLLHNIQDGTHPRMAVFERYAQMYARSKWEQVADGLAAQWDKAFSKAKADPEGTRVIVETNEEDPSANCNPFGRYYMVDGSESESSIEHAGQWVVIRVDTVTSPYEVHRPNWANTHGYADSWTQLACRCENPNNVTRWARLMIDAGRVTDIYADCY